MPRYRDNAPVEITCPKIDTVISFIEHIDWNMNDEEDVELNNQSKEVILIMEQIRKDNQTLREWGNEEYKRAIEFENERDYFEKQNKALQQDIDYYSNLIKQYE